MKNIVKYAGRAAAGALPAALVAEVGMPALGAVVFLAILVVRVICWIIGSGDCSERVTRMILARTGAPDARRRLVFARVPSAACASPFPVEQMSAGELCADPGTPGHAWRVSRGT